MNYTINRISVIVPVYNTDAYLEKCIHSILAQTYTDLEIILIDSGSTDKSGAICDQFARQDARIRVIHHQENYGPGAARNAGMDVATGEYLAFVDSDDYLDPLMYEKLRRQMRQDDSDMVCCGMQKVTGQGTLLETLETYPNAVLSSREYQRNCFGPHYGVYIVVWNKLYKHALIGDLRFPLDKLHEDEFFYFRAADRATTISTLSERLYYYVQRKDSIMGKVSTLRNLDGIEAFLQKAAWYRVKEDNELMERSLRQVCTFMSLYKRRLNLHDATTRARYRELKRQFRQQLYTDGWGRVSLTCLIGGTIFMMSEALFLKISGNG